MLNYLLGCYSFYFHLKIYFWSIQISVQNIRKVYHRVLEILVSVFLLHFHLISIQVTCIMPKHKWVIVIWSVTLKFILAMVEFWPEKEEIYWPHPWSCSDWFGEGSHFIHELVTCPRLMSWNLSMMIMRNLFFFFPPL